MGRPSPKSTRARSAAADAPSTGSPERGSRRSSRRGYLRVVAAGGLSLASGCSVGGRRPSFLLGAYPGEPVLSAVGPFERWLDETHAVVPLYTNADLGVESIDDFVAEQVAPVWSTGHIPMVTWLPYVGAPEQTPTDIERRIAEGQYDRFIDPWVARLDEWLNAGESERRLYFRPLPEMNGDWLPWSAIDPDSSTATFVAAWRHLYDRFAAAELSSGQIQWMWNPNVREVGGVRTEAYYPGDEYVDWIGIDGYNFGTSREWSEWTGPEAVFDPMVSRMRALADKPLGLPEFGTTSLRDGAYRPREKARWIVDAYDYIERAGIKMACWFNIDKETDWAVFGGERGTASFTTDETVYPVYPAYREVAQRTTAITGQGDASAFTREQFTGAF